jgi:hypothetical protein
MIEIQENVIPTPMLEEENTNEDVEPHAQIDRGDILNFLYNLLPHPSSQVERMGEVFCLVNFFVSNTFVVCFQSFIFLLKIFTLCFLSLSFYAIPSSLGLNLIFIYAIPSLYMG